MLDLILGYIQNLSPNIVFFIVTVFIFIELFRYWGTTKELAVEHGPAVLTTIGVLGTFVGITIGLANFDVNNIQESVPSLLGGLKTAFLTSILGIVAALVLRWKKLALKKDYHIADEKIFTPETFKASFDKHLEQQQKLIEIYSEQAKKSDIQQQELRVIYKEQQQALRNDIQDLSQKNTYALVNELSNIVRNFNTNLAEQFGENFKRLDN